MAQVLMDIQPGLGLLLGWDELHGWTHTYPGALVIALATGAAWWIWVAIRPKRFDNGPISHGVVVSSALFGTVSHVWLDSQFHSEMAKLTPGMLKLWTTGDVTTGIETSCLAAAGLGLVIYGMRNYLGRNRES